MEVTPLQAPVHLLLRLARLEKLSADAEHDPSLYQQLIESIQTVLKEPEVSADPQVWAVLYHELGTAYANLPSGSQTANLRISIGCYERSLSVYTPEEAPLEYAITCIDLGNACADLPVGDRTENYYRAITYYEKALAIITPEQSPMDYATLRNNAGVIHNKLQSEDRRAHLYQAIECFSDALRFRTPETAPLSYAATQNNLGNSYLELARYDQLASLPKAIECFQEAARYRSLEVAPIDYAATQNNLGVAYAGLPAEDPTGNLHLAIGCFARALFGCTPANAPLLYARIHDNMGNAYVDMAKADGKDLVDRAIHHYRIALETCSPEVAPAFHCKVAMHIGNAFASLRDWPNAEAAYCLALSHAEMIYQAAVTSGSRENELAEIEGLFRSHAYCAARLGATSQAIERIEAGRARILVDALALVRIPMERVAAPDHSQLAATCDHIRQMEAEARLVGHERPSAITAKRFIELSNELYHARRDLAKVVDGIRTYLPEFMLADSGSIPTGRWMPHDCALVYLLTTPQGSLALVAAPGSRDLACEQMVWLDAFTEDALDIILYGRKGNQGFLRALVQGNKALLTQQIDDMIPRITDGVMAPLVEYFCTQGYSRCIIVPCGRLGLLPLHAARLPDGRYVDGSLRISYAPNARVLLHARERLAMATAPVFLGVANPSHVHSVSVGDFCLALPLCHLPFAHREVETIACLFARDRRKTLCAGEATYAAVTGNLTSASYLHFACHGFFDPDKPMSSGLALAGEDWLTLADLVNRLDLSGTKVVVLSACHTALAEFHRLPDETIGLPAGFLQAGVSAVVGTLWPVEDLSTSLLLVRFYQNHLQDGLSLSDALVDAQRWLRESTVEEMALADHYYYLYCKSGGRDKLALDNWQYYSTHPKEVPFEHPFHWAAFTYTGPVAH